MLDAEEGELVDQSLKTEVRQNSGVDVNLTTQESKDKSRRLRNKKKNKRKKGNSGSNIIDVNRFVVDVGRRLKERKSYLVWTTVGCLAACMTWELADSGNEFITSVINGVDLVPTFSAASVDDLRAETVMGATHHVLQFTWCTTEKLRLTEAVCLVLSSIY